MLLSEKDPVLLKKNGYRSTEEAEEITRFYLSSLLDDCKSMLVDNSIDNIVIGVPEIWYETSIESRNKLERIAESIVGEGKVQLKSEPILACSYFVYNYEKSKGKDFVGTLLLIDYGGGTLDIAACRIRKESPRVELICKTGAGANTEKEIGKAGMSFIRNAVELALIKGGLNPPEIVKNKSYYACLHELEDVLKDEAKNIEKAFKLYYNEPETWNDLSDEFHTVSYNGDDYVLTYGMLNEAFENTIYNEKYGEDVLTKNLKNVMQELDNRGISYSADRDDFKIAMVGGFSNFYLVQNKVQRIEKLKRVTHDKRYEDFDFLFREANARENAIAYGAALMANGIITEVNQAPYSISLVCAKEGKNGVMQPDLDAYPYIVFEQFDVFDFDEVKIAQKVKVDKNNKPILDENGKKITTDLITSSSHIPYIKYNINGMYDIREPAKLIKLPKNTVIKIGFSLDKNYNLSLHIFEIDENGESTKKRPIKLTNIETLLGGLPDLKPERKKL